LPGLPGLPELPGAPKPLIVMLRTPKGTDQVPEALNVMLPDLFLVLSNEVPDDVGISS
jgi:hypothetical protein